LSYGSHDDDRGRRSNPAVVLVVDAGRDWSPDLLDEVGRQGFLVAHIEDIKRLPLVVGTGSVRAVLVHARSLDVNEVLLLRECRASAQRMSLVVVSSMAAQADVKRALDSSATAFLSLPASPHEVRTALLSGDRRRENSARRSTT
jgi:DNA-binding response OmpR family regulator